MNTAAFRWIPAALLTLACQLPTAQAQPTGSLVRVEKLHAQAVASYREGRFAEAYGRFMRLADAGHGRSAKLALWMHQNGTTVFGSEWDSTPEQQQAWAEAASRPLEAMQPLVAWTTPKRALLVAKR
jgi:hypothetical protein